MNKHTRSLLLCTSLAVPFSPSIHAEPPSGYTLAWSDEFDGDKLDLTRWVHRTDSKHWSTQSAANVAVAGGRLILNLKKESLRGKDYTGAGVISRETFQHGYYEARLKVPAGAGWHTSFWMMNHDGAGGTGTTSTAQELDVCEQDSVNSHCYSVNVHRWNPEPHQAFGYKEIDTPDLSADFHIFGCEFTPEIVKYFFDGELVRTIDATQFTHGDQHVWLTSIATFLGETKAVDETKLPATAEFDWVRFYRKSPTAK
jgi:beta-glucanase (GH16 family)